MKIQRALISVSDKTGIVEFARGLAAQGVEILSTGGTAKELQAAGIATIEVNPPAAAARVPVAIVSL